MRFLTRFSILFLFLTATLDARETTTLNLTIGATEVLAIDVIADVVVADESLLDVVLLDDKSLAIKAKASGYTELILRKKDGQIERLAVHIKSIEQQGEQV